MPPIQGLLFQPGTPGSGSQARSQELVEPFLPHLASAFQGAFNEFSQNVTQDTRLKLYGPTRGQIVTNLTWEHVRDALTGLDGIGFCDQLGFFKVLIENEIVIRFKRLNHQLLAASEDTPQALAWFANEPIRNFDPSLFRVNLGYRPDGDWLSCSEFYLTHQASFTALDWVSDIHVLTDADADQIESPADGLPRVEITPLQRPVIQIRDQA